MAGAAVLLAVALFAHGRTTYAQADQIGGLVIANSVGASVTTVLLRRQLGTSRVAGRGAEAEGRHSTTGALTRMAAAGLAGAATAAGVAAALASRVPGASTGAAVVVAVAAVADLLVYGAVLLLLGVEEARAAIHRQAPPGGPGTGPEASRPEPGPTRPTRPVAP